jgi:cysteine-rich repeat protein
MTKTGKTGYNKLEMAYSPAMLLAPFTESKFLSLCNTGVLIISFLAFLLAGLPGTVFAKTLERSCKGAWMVKYEMGGKTHTQIGPFTTSAKGTSKGTVPSPVKARRRACQAAAKLAANAVNEKRVLNEVCGKRKNDSGRIVFLGGTGRSKGEKQTHSTSHSLTPFQCRNGQLYERPICGDGKRTGIEECDLGRNNSDTIANRCRTDCTKPRCGDGVEDQGEQCDEGTSNHDLIPDSCRTNCKRGYCGDGIKDLSMGEMCDDGNKNPNDGCNNQCKYSGLP